MWNVENVEWKKRNNTYDKKKKNEMAYTKQENRSRIGAQISWIFICEFLLVYLFSMGIEWISMIRHILNHFRNRYIDTFVVFQNDWTLNMKPNVLFFFTSLFHLFAGKQCNVMNNEILFLSQEINNNEWGEKRRFRKLYLTNNNDWEKKRVCKMKPFAVSAAIIIFSKSFDSTV